MTYVGHVHDHCGFDDDFSKPEIAGESMEAVKSWMEAEYGVGGRNWLGDGNIQHMRVSTKTIYVTEVPSIDLGGDDHE